MHKKNDIIITNLNNQECLLHYSGVIFIPKIKALIISDIHFEKASALNIKKISTIPLPSFDTHEILITLNKIFKLFDPKKREEILPTGFIVGLKNIYLSTNIGRLLVIDIKSGKTISTLKIDKDKISRPFVSNQNLYLAKDNAIIKLN